MVCRKVFVAELVISAILLGFIGCDTGPKFYPVTGSVSYAGQPVADGEIIFADAAGSGASAVGRIEKGRYTLQATAGENQVRITASKETGRMLEGGMGAKIPERIDLIPAQYNTATTLNRTVDPHALTIDFDLK